MSDGEVSVIIFSLIISLFCWLWWYGVTLGAKSSPIPGRAPARGLLLITPFVAGVSLFAILRLWSASDVRDAGEYLALYTLLGMAWCGVASFVPAWLGISFRHDILIRGNRAATWVTCGWILATVLAFAGANVGDGPGWWVVIFSGMLSTGGLVLVFYAWEKLADSHDAILIDRDIPTGLRLAGMLVGCGAVFGVAAAGDWHSATATVIDFLWTAWAAIPIFVVAIFLHLLLRPTPAAPRHSVLTAGIVPMLLLSGMGFAWAVYAGRPIVGAVV